MSLVTRIGRAMHGLDDRELYRYVLGAFVVGALLFSLGAYRHHVVVAGLRSQLRRVNEERDKSRKLLERYARVQEQRATVETLVTKDPQFKIAYYITTLINELQLSKNVQGESEVSQRDAGGEYLEIDLTLHLHDIDIKQLVDVLSKIRQSPRVYTQELKITKSKTSRLLDTTIVVATFEAKKSLS